MLKTSNSSPQLFRQGLSPNLLLVIYISLSCVLFVFDLKYNSVDLIRTSITLVVEPLQRIVQIPEAKFIEIYDYFTDLNTLHAENKAYKTKHLQLSKDLLRFQQIQAENVRLKELLKMQQQQALKGEVGQILYTARDPFSKKVIIDKGYQNDNVQTGQAVIDENGIVGQITKTFPFTSEVTLITDKNQSLYVKIRRTGQRAIMFGLSNGLLDLRYVSNHMDVKIGDILETSGLDNVYPAGFPVAKVIKVDKNPAFAFTQINCVPLASVENSNEVLVLNKLTPLPDYPQESEANSEEEKPSSESEDEKTAKK